MFFSLFLSLSLSLSLYLMWGFTLSIFLSLGKFWGFRVREGFKDDPFTGAGLNHGAKDEPNWRDAFWGSNRARLESLKKELDPENRFNCFHCVGYQGVEGPENLSAGCSLKVLSRAKATIACVTLAIFFLML